jgi:hypothetical protein
MLTFLMFCLGTIGLANILVHGRIMDVIGLRPLARKILTPLNADSMLDCYECMGFWSGLLNGIIWFMGSTPLWFLPFVVIASGWVGSVLSQTYTDLMYIVRSNIEFVVGEEDGKEEEEIN